MVTTTHWLRKFFARTLWQHCKRGFVVLSLAILLVPLFSYTRVLPHTGNGHATALTNSTLNFQARLQTSAGAIAPDGYYHVEFKLYDALTGGTLLWTETRTTGNLVRVAHGYLTVDLGSVTGFPSTIPWDQQLYLTMNIGGTAGTATWDGEMSPRLKLTAVPYAFNAKTASQLATSNGGFLSTLSIANPTGGNQTFQIQDQGAGGTYNLLTAPTGTDGYIKLQTNTPGTQQTGNFNINGTGIAASLQGTTSLLTPTLDTATATALNIGTSGSPTATSISMNQNTTVKANLVVQDGASLAVLTANTTAKTVQVGSTTADSNVILFGLDKYDQAADPTGFNGAMYFNTVSSKMRCYQAGAWTDCVNSGSSGANTSLSNLASVNIGTTALNSTSNNLNLTTTTSGNIVLNSAGTIELQDATNVTGAFTASGTINTNTLTSTTLSFSGANPTVTASTLNTNISLEANGTGQVYIGGTSTGDILLGGGSASTGCTLANASGNWACTGTVTAYNLSGTNTGNVTLSGQNYVSIAGQVITANQINLTSHVTGVLPLGNGGTGGNLTASNGGIVWTDGSQMQVLAGTATAGQCLISGSNAAPSWASCGAAAANQSLSNLTSPTNINQALNTTAGNLSLTTTTSGNIVLNSAGTIELQDATNVTGSLSASTSVLTPLLDRSTAGTLTIGGTATTVSVVDRLDVQPTNNANAFRVQYGGGGQLFNVDTTNSRVSVGATALAATLFSVNTSTSIAIAANTTSTTTNIMNLQNNGTNVFSVLNNGGVNISTSSATVSDFQIKSGGTILLNGDMVNNVWVNNSDAYAGNLLENPSFESDAAFNASGWNITAGKTINTDSNARYGTKQLTITPNGTDRLVNTTKHFVANPGDMFYLEGWIKAAAGTDGIARLHIMYYNAAGTYINQSIVVGTNSATYTKASVVGTAPANTAYLVVTAGVDNTSTTGTWYFDDLYFAKVSRNEPLQLGSTTTDASAAFLGLDSYNQASDPSGGFNGAMYYNTSTNKFRCYENGMWNNCLTGALYSTTADATTVDGNTAMVQNLSTTYTMPANYCTTGRVIQLYASGVATSTTTAQPIQFVIRFGTTNLTALSNNYTPANSQTNVGWTLDASLTCRAAPSAASAVLAQGTVVGQTSTTATVAGTAHALAPANTAGVNVATNAAQTVTVGVQFSGTANAANTLTLKQMYVNPL